jgi:hypothetical protein
MITPSKLVSYLIICVAAVGVLLLLFGQKGWVVLVSALFFLFVAGSILEGQISVGRGYPMIVIRRQKSPVLYWFVVVLYFACGIAFAVTRIQAK